MRAAIKSPDVDGNFLHRRRARQVEPRPCTNVYKFILESACN